MSLEYISEELGKENLDGNGGVVPSGSPAISISHKLGGGAADSPMSVGSGGSLNFVVYDRVNAIDALYMLLDRENLTLAESKRIVTMLVKYIDYADVQRHTMVEKEAALSTELMKSKQELASSRQGYEEAKREARELKRTTARLMAQQEEMALELNNTKISLDFSRQKEIAAVEACKKSAQQVHDVKRDAAMKIDNAHKRLQELEVHMHLAGCRGVSDESTCDTMSEAAEVFNSMHPAKSPAAVEDPEAAAPVSAVATGLSSDEGRLLRSEMALMQRKVDKSNALLNKTTRAAQKIQEKLADERRKVAALEEERSQLQQQVLKLHQKPQGMDPSHVGKLIHDLASARSKVENLDLDRNSLADKLASLQNEMSTIADEQRQALMKAEETASLALHEEKAKCDALQEEVELLVDRLQQANKSLEDFQATQSSLEEAQKRCAELAGLLDQEQRSSYDRSREVERLAKAAQACAAELSDMKQQLHSERTNAHLLEIENSGLTGKVQALSQALESQENSSEVIESLAEARALLQSQLNSAESEKEALRTANVDLGSRLSKSESYIEELEIAVETLKDDLSKSQSDKTELDCSLTAATSDMDHLVRSNEELKAALDDVRNNLEGSRQTVVSLQQQLEERNAELAKAHNDFEDMCDCLKASEDTSAALLEDKNSLTQQNGRLEVEVEHLKLTIGRLDQQIADSKSATNSLEASLKAAEIQCDALRKANVDAQKDSLTMVDSMNEMSNLIDSVNDLQASVHELQGSLAASQLKVARLEEDKAALLKEVQVYETHVAHSQEKLADMRSCSEEDRAKYAQATRRLDALSLQLDAVRKELEQKVLENTEKQSQIVELLALDASNADEILSAKKRIKSLRKSLSESNERINCLENLAKKHADENHELGESNAKLEEALQQSQELLAVTEGKLTVCQSRVEILEAATSHVDALTKEFENLRLKYKGLQKQHARDSELYQQLAVKYDEAVKDCESKGLSVQEKEEQIIILSGDLEDSQRLIAELEQSQTSLQEEVSRLSVLEPQIALLQSHISDGGAWCEAASAALDVRAKEVENALAEVSRARQETQCVSEERAVAQERASAAEASLEHCQKNLREAELTKEAALKATEAMKEEIFVLSSHHKEMIDVIDSMKEYEREYTSKYEEACAQLENMKISVDQLKEQLHLSGIQTSELKAKLQHTSETKDQIHAENERLRESASENAVSLSLATSEIDETRRELERVNEVCNGLRSSLEEASLSLMDRESTVNTLKVEVGECRAHLHAEETSSRILKDKCDVLEKELDYLQDLLLRDNSTSDQLEELVNFIGGEKAQMRSDIVNLNRLIDGLRDEMNATRSEARDLYASKAKADEKLLAALGKNTDLSETVASLQRDIAVLEVVKEQLEGEVVKERDDATRSKIFCKEAEREVSTLRNDYQLFNQAIHGRLSAYEPILRRIESGLAERLAKEIEADGVELIHVPNVPEQGERILQSLQRAERNVGEVLDLFDGFVLRQSEHEHAAASWNLEKKVFKMVIKLALAIASDNISGKDEASSLYEGLIMDESMMDLLGPAGLQHIWDSLAKLAQSKSGLQKAKKLRHLSLQLQESNKNLEQKSEELMNEQKRSLQLCSAIQYSCQAMLDMRNALDAVSGDVAVDTPMKIGSDTAQEMRLCVDMLQTSVHVILRRYRSMARNVGSFKASKPTAVKLTKDNAFVRRNDSNQSDKIGAIKYPE
jgi:chromosome segregation ATPase